MWSTQMGHISFGVNGEINTPEIDDWTGLDKSDGRPQIASGLLNIFGGLILALT